jgi:uncharacterized protein (TIGR02453 family)
MQSGAAFQGKETPESGMNPIFPFLRDLSAHNNKVWFDANRARYEEARSAFAALVEEWIPAIAVFEDLGPLTVKNTLFRINRDVRFSRNKNPYKTNFSALIARGGKKHTDVFGYYVHLEPGNCFMAAGMYEPTAAQLARIRQEIDYNGDRFRAITGSPGFRAIFGDMEGKKLKTAPRGYSADHPDIGYLRHCQFYFCARYSEEEVLDPGFPRKLADHCSKIRPFLVFLNESQD